MDLLSVFGEFFHFLGTLFPRWHLIRSTEGGVVFRRNGERIVNGPRLIWWLPCVSDLETVPIVRQVIDLEPQTLMTKDDVQVVASGVVVYDIDDVRKYLVENYDAELSLAEVASAALREVIVGARLEEIQRNTRKTMDNALTKAAKEHLAEFGVRVERMRLTDFSKAMVVNYVGAGAGGYVPSEEEDE